MTPAEQELVIELDGCERLVPISLDHPEEVQVAEHQGIRGVLEEIQIVCERNTMRMRDWPEAAKLVDMLLAPLSDMNQG